MHRPLLRYARQLTRDEDAAYDVVQDGFIKLWEYRLRLDPEKSLKSLLYAIVRNGALNHVRRVKTQEARLADMPPTSAAVSPDVDERIDTKELGDRIREWILEMPPKRREAFQLSRFDGLSHEEIADVMELAPRTVTNHIMLALQFLRDRLQAYQTNGA